MAIWRLFYDGGCNLCHVSKLRVEQWAERAGQELVAVPIQSPAGMERGYDLNSMVLETNGEVLHGADAWLKLLTISPWYLRPVSWIARVPIFRPLLKWGYGVVAKYRLKWFGSRACQIPQNVTKG